METREPTVATSCFRFALSPMIVTSPLLARRPVSSPPSTKCCITSPKDLPSGAVPVLDLRRKSKAESTVWCHLNCCGTVMALRFSVLACALMMPVSTSLCFGRTFLSKTRCTFIRFTSGSKSWSMSTAPRLVRPSLARSLRRSISTATCCVLTSITCALPAAAPSMRRLPGSVQTYLRNVSIGMLAEAAYCLHEMSAMISPFFSSQWVTALVNRCNGSPLDQSTFAVGVATGPAGAAGAGGTVRATFG